MHEIPLQTYNMILRRCSSFQSVVERSRQEMHTKNNLKTNLKKEAASSVLRASVLSRSGAKSASPCGNPCVGRRASIRPSEVKSASSSSLVTAQGDAAFAHVDQVGSR